MFVMPAGDASSHLEPGSLAQDLLAEHRMSPHDLPLVRGERPGLEQDSVGNVQLADVVEHCRPADVGRLLRVEAHGSCQLLRQQLHAADVVTRIGVLRLGAARQGNHAVALTLCDLDRGGPPAERRLPRAVEHDAGEGGYRDVHCRPNRPRVELLDPTGQSHQGGQRAKDDRNGQTERHSSAPAEGVRRDQDRQIAKVIQRIG